MDSTVSINKARAYLSTQMQGVKARKEPSDHRVAFVTISRESGAGGLVVADHLAELLTERGVGGDVPWAVFEKNVLEKVVEENDLPESYMDQMEEKVLPAIHTAVSEMLAVHPSISRLAAMTSRTLLHLATMGNAILVGRGANVLTKTLSVGLHVRLIASPDCRVRFLMERYGMSRDEAERRMDEEDEGRRYYVKKHFNQNVDDPVLYDMVLNTDRMGHVAAAELIADALETRLRQS